MRNEVKDFKRQNLFEQYDSRTNPFLYITTKIDITNIVTYCKIHKNYYATIGYFINITANEMDCFKYRKENGKIYKYDYLRIDFTQMKDENSIGFFGCNTNLGYKKFINEFEKNQEDFYHGNYQKKVCDEGEIWVSCAPWFEYTSLITPYDKNITVPQFIWGKFTKENNRIYTNLTIMVHHGFADGNHIGIFLKKLNEKITNFEEIINKEV